MDEQYIRKARRNYYYALDILKVMLAIVLVLRHCGQSFFDGGSAFNIILTNTLLPLRFQRFLLYLDFCFSEKRRT